MLGYSPVYKDWADTVHQIFERTSGLCSTPVEWSRIQREKDLTEGRNDGGTRTGKFSRTGSAPADDTTRYLPKMPQLAKWVNNDL